MKVGFTGTQQGMTDAQSKVFDLELDCINEDNELHHGDCIGADAQAHWFALQTWMDIVLHPPKNESKRAFCLGSNATREPKDYLIRNHDIVDETDMLVATPKEYTEQLRSGTWATIRYARKMNKPVTIVYPDGTVGH